MNKIKFLLCFALLVSGVDGRGQIYINSYRFGGSTGELLLDSFPADAAYSFRKIDKDYNGDCIIVRRSSGSPALDTIGFVDNYLDTVTLKTFCAGVNCFVREFYDQSGFGRNMKQTTDANQPQIVTSGVLEKDGNFVALKFDGTNDKLVLDTIATFNYSGAFSFFAAIGTHTSPGNDFLGNRGTSSGFAYVYRTGASRYGVFNVAFNENVYTIAIRTKHIASGIRSSTNDWNLYVNNNIGIDGGTNGYSSSDATKLTIGADGDYTGSNQFNGKVMEIIFYKSDKETDRGNIQNNINKFYSIY